MILSLARAISEHKPRFKHTLKLELFCGEEQGLVGSRFLAKEYREYYANISLMIQGDMLGFRKPGEDRQVGFAARYATPLATQFAFNV